MQSLPSALIAVVGPTASGKTAAAVALCRALDAEAISMDSMQVYRGMDIGTAKPTQAEQSGVTHHLLDVADPGTPFSVADYRELADAAINHIGARGRLPVLVGGTGLYLNALTLDMDFAQTPADRDFRRQLEGEDRELLHARLAQVDPQSARRLHVNDVRRVMRALEIHHLTGKPMSAHAVGFRTAPRGPTLIAVGLTMERSLLHSRIDTRVHEMIGQGWLEEVTRLLDAGVPENSQAMQAIGYRELAPVVQGETKLEEAIPRIQQTTRQYAKRQMTWFRRDPRVHWFDWADYPEPGALDAAILAYVRGRL
ncbi:MAG: tRNA (adenosine(37)-N6)-dimethylallyltransferase MiaA [Clostridia bacterium]|nr:tRNA (adenosine(37)-N6)-dimethylallyltransferase MiaA [Clostridia bacterium]